MRLIICGPGRCGKDSASIWFRNFTTLRYHDSTSEAAAKVVYRQLASKYGYSSVEEAFKDRHNHRQEWADAIGRHNQPDGLTLYTDMLENNDILNGVRWTHELEAIVNAGLIDLVIWIERDVPHDPSLTFDANAADIIIPNNQTLYHLYARLERLGTALQIMR